MKNARVAYLFLAPSFAFFAGWVLLPLILVGRLAMYKTNYITWQFVGLKNFLTSAMEPLFQKAVLNSLYYAFMVTVGNLMLSVFMALLVCNTKKWLQDTMRFTLYIPLLASGIIIGNVWRWIWHPSAGLANWFISLVGLEPIAWLTYRPVALLIITMIIITTTQGFAFLVLLASIHTIPTSLFDAAKIDGASWLQIKLRIILPQLMPTIALISMLSIVAAPQIWETIYILTNGGPMGGTATMLYDSWRTAFSAGQHGLAAAKSLLLLMLVFALSWTKWRIEGGKNEA